MIFAAVKEEFDGGLTVPELINSVKSALQKAGEGLESREDNLKREIEAKKKEIESLQKNLKEFGDLKNLAARLREERDKLSNRLKEKEDDQKGMIVGQGEEEYLKIEMIADQGEEEYLKKEVIVGQAEEEYRKKEAIAGQGKEMKAEVLGEVKHPRNETKQIGGQVKEEMRIGGGDEVGEKR